MNKALLKDRLEIQGWTVAACRERMAGCRKGLAEAYARNRADSIYTYRLLYVCEYLRNRNRIAILTS